LAFNCRLGDPEAQAVAALMDFDVAEVLRDVAAGTLQPSKLGWKSGARVCVVLASGGYPGKFEVGKRIEGLTSTEQITGVKVLHAGTKRVGEAIVTSGGRVLGVTAAGPSIDAALSSAYKAAARIPFDGMHYRQDIREHERHRKAKGTKRVASKAAGSAGGSRNPGSDGAPARDSVGKHHYRWAECE